MKIKIGILKEEKCPKDNRVVLTPDDAKKLMLQYSSFEIYVEPDTQRCFADKKFQEAGCILTEDLAQCDVLLGVKEVPIEKLIPHKTYFFFSHTIKKQPYNRLLLQKILEKKITLIDYECITDVKGIRMIAFGRFAGIVGAHNTLVAYGKKTRQFNFPSAHSFSHLEALYSFHKKQKLPPLKIIVTGGGRVAKGVLETLKNLNVKSVSPEKFLNQKYDQPVFSQLDSQDLYFRKDGTTGMPTSDFYAHPHLYFCHFKPYYSKADIMINAIFWNADAPPFFTTEEMKSTAFHLKTIGDISCDIKGSIPATLRASTIENPVYGYHPKTEQETLPYLPESIDIMAVDNLPNELPKDASQAFSTIMTEKILPELLRPSSELLQKATIAQNATLSPQFAYLKNFVSGIE